ncbi:hypothetical protein [Caulobacter sp. LARHSG274]
MYVQTPDQLISFAGLALCSGLALWRGRRVERIAGVAMILAWFATPLVHNAHQTFGPQVGEVVVDVLLLLVLLILALTSDRWWPMAAAAFQGVTALTHLAAAIDTQIVPRAYYVAGSLLSYLTMAALLVGAVNVRRADRA